MMLFIFSLIARNLVVWKGSLSYREALLDSPASFYNTYLLQQLGCAISVLCLPKTGVADLEKLRYNGRLCRAAILVPI